MKASAEKSSTTSSASAAKAEPQPFFAKSPDEDRFFPPVMPSAAPALQARLQAGQHRDRYEREADWMAERVVWPTDNVWKQYCSPENKEKIQFKPLAASVTPFTPGKLESEESSHQTKNLSESIPFRIESEPRLDEREEPLQKQEEREEPAQGKRLDRGPLRVLPSIEKSIRSHRGLGSPLGDTVLTTMEKGFGADFSKVRLHTGSQAADLSKNLSSQAFTVRNDIFFAQDKYNPATTEGKLLLAHELTHTIQQGASKALPMANENAVAHAAVNLADDMRARRQERLQKSAGQEKIVPLPPATAKPPAVSTAVPYEQDKKVGKKESLTTPVLRKIPPPAPAGTVPSKAAPVKSPSSWQEDPAFKAARGKIIRSARQQRSHETVETKISETDAASALPALAQQEQDAKTKRVGELEKVGETQQQTYHFDADNFEKMLLQKIEAILPENEDQAKDFPKSNKLEEVKDDFSGKVAKESQTAAGPVDAKIEAPLPPGEVQKPDDISIPDPKPAAPMPKISPKAIAPKPKADQEISLQHESDKLDDLMTENRLTRDQLADSNEPKFIQALNFKEKTQQRIAETPGMYRQQEQAILTAAQQQAGQAVKVDLGAMHGKKNRTGKGVFTNQGKTETKTEKRQREIKNTIDELTRGTVNDVTNILKVLTDTVQSDFSQKLERMTALFNESVTRRLKDYYGDWRIDDELFGPVSIVKDPKTGEIKFINPDVYAIFQEEKDWYLKAMGRILHDTARKVADGLNQASQRIQKGWSDIDAFKKTLKGDELEYANHLTEEVKVQFDNLESSIQDTQTELLDSLSQQYKDNVNQLEKSFNEINDELKKSWLDKAAEFIKTVGKTIYQLADLLLSILTRIAAIVWDIIKHPIRFFETLVRGLINGIGTFIDDIGTYLEEAFWSWVTGATAAKGIRLGPGSAVEKLFGLVVQVLSISPADLKKMAEKVFGPEVVGLVEKGLAMGQAVIAGAQKILEPAIILLRDGVGAFWSYLKETIGGIIDGVFAKIKETVFFEFVKKGLKYIAGFFVPGGGFVKVVKALFAAVEFLVNNMDKIRAVVDSILGSFEKAIRGDDSGVAARVLQGLKIGVVLALDFLARLLGLDTILEKVHKFFHDLRKPILQGIEWVMRQIRTGLEKIGFFKWLDNLKKGRTDRAKDKKLKGVGESVPFTAGSDHHRIFIKVSRKTATVMVESSPKPLEAALTHMESQMPMLAPESRNKAPALIGLARSLLSKTDREADQVAAAIASPESAGAGTAASINDQVKTDEHTLATTLSELFNLFGATGRLPLSVPVNMAGAGHKLILKDEGGHLTVWFATKEQAIRDKYAQVDRILKRWEDYISGLGNPAIKDYFTLLLKPDIEEKKTTRLKADVARLEGVKSKEFATLKEEIDKTVKQLAQEISDWAISAGIPVQDFSDEAVKAELDRRADEAAERLWRTRQEETQQKLTEYAARIQALDPDARLKYRGSLAKFRRGVSKDFAEFDPNNFDIDFFVQSDKLYLEALALMADKPERPGELWADAHPGLKALLYDMAQAYDSIPGVRKGKFSMKLRSVTNVQELLAKKGIHEYAGEKHVEIIPPPPPPPPTKP